MNKGRVLHGAYATLDIPRLDQVVRRSENVGIETINGR